MSEDKKKQATKKGKLPSTSTCNSIKKNYFFCCVVCEIA